jgi:putative endonuclease
VAPPQRLSVIYGHPEAILRETRGILLAKYFTGPDTLKIMFYVYVLRSETEKFYIGYSANLRRRIKEHLAKLVATTKSGQYQLVYYEAYINKADAVGRELFLKSGSGHKYLRMQLKHYLTEDVRVDIV